MEIIFVSKTTSKNEENKENEKKKKNIENNEEIEKKKKNNEHKERNGENGKNCYLEIHMALLPNGHYPNGDAIRRPCEVCKKRTSVVCNACGERFCLSDKKECF